MKVFGGCVSDVGNRRKENQDALFLEIREQSGWYFAVGAVCDGIGGLEKGNVASAFIIDAIRKWFYSVTEWLDIRQADTGILFAHLKDAAEAWNEQLYEYGQIENIRMGTTMSVIVFLRDAYSIVHVGDSRIYQYRKELKVLTTDACVAVLKNGSIKKYLDNYMGKKRELWFQMVEGSLLSGDMILFCSDGFYHHLEEEDVKKIYQLGKKERKLENLLSDLIKIMIERGERDNISVGVLLAE